MLGLLGAAGEKARGADKGLGAAALLREARPVLDKHTPGVVLGKGEGVLGSLVHLLAAVKRVRARGDNRPARVVPDGGSPVPYGSATVPDGDFVAGVSQEEVLGLLGDEPLFQFNRLVRHVSASPGSRP